MKRPLPTRANTSGETVTVVSISPIAEDHVALKRLFDRSEWSAYTESKWTIQAASTLESALQVLKNHQPPIVLSERDLFHDTWRDVLRHLSFLPDPPLLIVTSQFADEYLWSEALNVGAYDVLAKPFDPEEVIRVLCSAWLHRNNHHETTRRTRTLQAAAAG